MNDSNYRPESVLLIEYEALKKERDKLAAELAKAEACAKGSADLVCSLSEKLAAAERERDLAYSAGHAAHLERKLNEEMKAHSDECDMHSETNAMLVKELQAERERAQSYKEAAESYRHAHRIAQDAGAQLIEERDRYRAALERIRDKSCSYCADCPPCGSNHKEIAREALEGK